MVWTRLDFAQLVLMCLESLIMCCMIFGQTFFFHFCFLMFSCWISQKNIAIFDDNRVNFWFGFSDS